MSAALIFVLQMLVTGEPGSIAGTMRYSQAVREGPGSRTQRVANRQAAGIPAN